MRSKAHSHELMVQSLKSQADAEKQASPGPKCCGDEEDDDKTSIRHSGVTNNSSSSIKKSNKHRKVS